MANPEHIAFVKRGREAVARRFETKDGPAWLDLSGINLVESGLLECLGSGFSSIDLSGADLRGVQFGGGSFWENDFSGADMTGANLSGARLCYSHFERANLRSADMSSADLSGAYLSNADLTGANLRGACLDRASLMGAVLDSVCLDEADLSEAIFGYTCIRGTSLCTARGLTNVVHRGPSSADIYASELTLGAISKDFLLGCGLTVTGAVPGMRRNPPCFVIAGEWEEDAEQVLIRELKAHYVPAWTWFALENSHEWLQHAPEWCRQRPAPDLPIGVAWLCSERALANNWVIEQVQFVLDMEQQAGYPILIPAALDDFALSNFTKIVPALSGRQILDWRTWGSDRGKKKAVRELVGLLRSRRR